MNRNRYRNIFKARYKFKEKKTQHFLKCCINIILPTQTPGAIKLFFLKIWQREQGEGHCSLPRSSYCQIHMLPTQNNNILYVTSIKIIGIPIGNPVIHIILGHNLLSSLWYTLIYKKFGEHLQIIISLNMQVMTLKSSRKSGIFILRMQCATPPFISMLVVKWHLHWCSQKLIVTNTSHTYRKIREKNNW